MNDSINQPPHSSHCTISLCSVSPRPPQPPDFPDTGTRVLTARCSRYSINAVLGALPTQCPLLCIHFPIELLVHSTRVFSQCPMHSLFLGGILAFDLGFSEFLLVSRTSMLTLSIASIFKEVCTLLVGSLSAGWSDQPPELAGLLLPLRNIPVCHPQGPALQKGWWPKPSKGLGSNPDLELLLQSSQPEEDGNEVVEEEEYFMAQG